MKQTPTYSIRPTDRKLAHPMLLAEEKGEIEALSRRGDYQFAAARWMRGTGWVIYTSKPAQIVSIHPNREQAIMALREYVGGM